MSIGEENTECPLCMEPLELDDINFFPCTCGYQICRFCWHRIRTDENGLCPACRKQYPEDPAEFKPLTEDELQRIKKERRQKDLQRKQKAAENRKHLANVRVVQRNLVFVVGLSQRLAEPDILKKHEYFGKFGKIHKVVINQSTSYAGAQGPSASAYVTYHRPEDALRAIQSVNNVYVDGRTLKASLGTTKYCSHFLRGAQCPKPDCMYLHELGEEAASFTKEEMQQGKHQEYEQKLYETFMNNQNLTNHHIPAVTKPQQQSRKKAESDSPPTVEPLGLPPHPQPPGKEAWPTLAGGGPPGPQRPDRLTNGNKVPHTQHSQGGTHKQDTQNAQNRAPGHHRSRSQPDEPNRSKDASSTLTNHAQNSHPPGSSSPQGCPVVGVGMPPHNPPPPQGPPTVPLPGHTHTPQSPIGTSRKSPLFDPTNGNASMSLFSTNAGFSSARGQKSAVPHTNTEDSIHSTEIPDTIPVSSTTDWQAAFGFGTSQQIGAADLHNDDDLGFDPWAESTQALADLMQMENGASNGHSLGSSSSSLGGTLPPPGLSGPPMGGDPRVPQVPPPGFLANHHGAYNGAPGLHGGSKMLGLMQLQGMPPSMPPQTTFHDVLSDIPLTAAGKDPMAPGNAAQGDAFDMKHWQEGLRALLPNINISFGAPNEGNHNNTQQQPPHRGPSQPQSAQQQQQQTQQQIPAHNTHKSSALTEDPPHWMASLQHLTEDNSTNHRLPFVQQFQFRGSNVQHHHQHPQFPNHMIHLNTCHVTAYSSHMAPTDGGAPTGLSPEQPAQVPHRATENS